MNVDDHHTIQLHQSFDGEREAAFIADNAVHAQYLISRTFPLAAVIFFGFWLGDHFLFQRFGDPVIRLAMASVALLSTLFGLWARHSRNPLRLVRLAPWLLVFNSLAMATVVARCNALGIPEPKGLMALHLFYVFFLSGLLTRDAAGVALLSCAAYFYAHLWFSTVTPMVAEHVLGLAGLAVLGTIGNRIHEGIHRRNWLLRREVTNQARHDPLTGLINRRALFQQAAGLFASAARAHQPVSVLLLDVDYFKRLNDSCGHAAGDEALRRIAAAVQQAARRPTDMAARFGGEEFLVLLHDCNLEDARSRAEALRETLQALHIAHPDSPFGHITASFGVLSDIPAWHDSLEEWADEADDLLYAAKGDGRNRVHAAARQVDDNDDHRWRLFGTG